MMNRINDLLRISHFSCELCHSVCPEVVNKNQYLLVLDQLKIVYKIIDKIINKHEKPLYLRIDVFFNYVMLSAFQTKCVILYIRMFRVCGFFWLHGFSFRSRLLMKVFKRQISKWKWFLTQVDTAHSCMQNIYKKLLHITCRQCPLVFGTFS